MSIFFRIMLASALIMSVGIQCGCAKKEEGKPKVTKKKAKKPKKVAPKETESVTEETETSARSPAMPEKSGDESTPESPVLTQKTAGAEAPTVETTELPLPKESSEVPLGSTQEGPISSRSSKEQEKWVLEFESQARKKRPADDAKVNVLTREEYEAQFKAELNLHKKFAGQFIEVNGVVASMFLVGPNNRFLYLASEEKPFEHNSIPYHTLDREPWAAVAEGQKVKLRAWWADPPGWVFEIVEKGPSTAVTRTADEVVAEFNADETKARKKYFGKGFLISGELLKMDTENGDLRFIVFNTQDEIKVTVDAVATPKYVMDKLEIGKPLKAYGELVDVNQERIAFGGFVISPDRSTDSDSKTKP